MTLTRLVYAKKISKKLKRKVWLKMESENFSGSHKDRESKEIIKFALANKMKSVGCASTGNLAVSLAYFAKVNNLNCYVWLAKKDINFLNLHLLKSLGAKIKIINISLEKLYTISENFMKKNRIVSANQGSNDIKIKANSNIIKEIYSTTNKIKNFITCVNNGSHFLGLYRELKKGHNIFGITSSSKFASSINPKTKFEKNFYDKNTTQFTEMIDTDERDILNGYHILKLENIFAEPSSLATVGALQKKELKGINNICCVITGSANRHLTSIKDLLKKNNIRN